MGAAGNGCASRAWKGKFQGSYMPGMRNRAPRALLFFGRFLIIAWYGFKFLNLSIEHLGRRVSKQCC